MRAMRDSGIPWIGEIPKDWELSKGKYLFSITTGKLDVNAEEPDGAFPFFTCSMFPKRINSYSFDCEALLVAGNGIVGFTQYYNGKFDAYQRTYVLSDFHNADPMYLKYYVSNNLITEVMPKSVGSVIQFIKLGDLQSFNVVLPCLEEQQRIVSFLDAECARIDAVMEQTRASIEEYKKLKQSIITEAVTKGIRPNRPMKNTGEEWLESIPAGWEMKRGKWLFCETDKRSADGSEELLTVSQYTGITPRSQKNVTMFEAETLEGYKICEVGDIAANTMWLWAGAIGVSRYRGVISPSYNIYRQIKQNYNSIYLDYLLRTSPLVQRYESLSTGIRASRLRLYPEQFLGIRYPVPPMEEQEKIVEFLADKTSAMDNLIAKKEQFLAEMETYKKSLIYEYVTGKKEIV